jgi:hypothetical protein
MARLNRCNSKSGVISRDTQLSVWKRSGYSCEMCGYSRGDADPYLPGRTIRLTVGRLNAELRAGRNTRENLRTLCNNCSDGLKGIAVPPRPSRIELLSLVRRASVANQLQLLQWLRTKHPGCN